jgi:hypothetical protein
MKAIKISLENAAAIEAALKSINGRSDAHCYTTFGEVFDLTESAEQKLDGLFLPTSLHKGAVWKETSGGKVANSYKGITRNATRITIERRSTGWFLVDVAQASIFKQGGGAGRLTLTAEQAKEAAARFASQFSVAAA